MLTDSVSTAQLAATELCRETVFGALYPTRHILRTTYLVDGVDGDAEVGHIEEDGQDTQQYGYIVEEGLHDAAPVLPLEGLGAHHAALRSICGHKKHRKVFIGCSGALSFYIYASHS